MTEVTADDAAQENRQWWWVVLAAGVAGGLGGAALNLLLRATEWLALGVHPDSLLTGSHGIPVWRLVAAPFLGATLAAVVWHWLRGRGRIRSISKVAKPGGPAMHWPDAVLDACTQIVLVGSGASLGRETAPREVAASITDAVARRARVPDTVRADLVAAAAGAGLAAVYNVPLAGAVFTLEVITRRWSNRLAVLALVASGLATVCAWPVISSRPTYVFPHVVSWGYLPWALAAVPLWALVGIGFDKLVRTAEARGVHRGRPLLLALPLVGLALGVVSVGLSAITGNGKEIVQLALFPGLPTLGLLAALTVVKPVMTAAFLRSGATGGIITPALAVGAGAGGVLAMVVGHPELAPVVAICAAAAVLAVSQKAPLFGGLMGWELTHATPVVGVGIMVCSGLSWALSQAPGWMAAHRSVPPTLRA